MTTPSLAQPWVLIRYGDAAPALAYLTTERWAGCFYGDLMVVEMNQTRGVPEYRKRYENYPSPVPPSCTSSPARPALPGSPKRGAHYGA